MNVNEIVLPNLLENRNASESAYRMRDKDGTQVKHY